MQVQRDHPRYVEQNVRIAVVSGQGEDAVRRWLAQNSLPFPWLVDDDRSVLQAYGVYNHMSYDAWRMAHPSAILIAPTGRITWIYRCSHQWDIPKSDVMMAGLATLQL